MRFIYKLLILGTSLLAVACQHQIDERLMQANALMNSDAKKAMEILSAIDNSDDFNKQERALYGLLSTQVLDKNALSIESDSMIRVALHYYERKSPSIELAKCYFYLGCYFVDAFLKEQAIQAFLDAEKIALPFDDWALLGLIYGRLENEYSEQGDWTNAFTMNDRTIACFQQSKGEKNEYISYLRRGKMYIIAHRMDSARYYMQKAADGFLSIRDTTNYAWSLTHIATIELSTNKVQKAKEIALKARNLTQNSPIPQIDFGLAMIYENAGQLDSARTIALQQLKNPDAEYQYSTYFMLADIEESRGDYPAALQALKSYCHLRDSLYGHHIKHSTFRYAQLYNRQQAETTEQILLSRQQFLVAVVVILFALLFTTYFMLVNRSNRRKREKAETRLYTTQLENQIYQLQLMYSPTENEKEIQSFFQTYMEMLKKLVEINGNPSNSEKIRQERIREVWEKYVLTHDLESLKTIVNALYRGFGNYLEENYKSKLPEKDFKHCILICCHFDIKGIAAFLNISEKTVYNQRSKIARILSPDSSDSLEQVIEKLQQQYTASFPKSSLSSISGN